jgi:hypothetical protein
MEHTDRGRRRGQWIALILSGLFPGLGQLYLRAWGKGVACLLVALVGFGVIGQMSSLDGLLAGVPPSPGTLVVGHVLVVVIAWSLWDAWRTGGEPR